MSKERALRRAEREAARAVAEAKRQRRERRRARRSAMLRRLRPKSGGRRAWGLGRRTPAQRSALVGFALAALLAIWYFVDSWSGRIALSLLVLLALPVVAVVTFDRKGMKL